MKHKTFIIFVLSLFCFSAFLQSGEIHNAAKQGHLGQIAVMLKADPKLANALDEQGRNPLHYSASRGNLEVSRLLIEKGADIFIKEKRFGGTPLHFSIFGGNKELTALLLEKGAPADEPDNYGGTALHMAAMQGKIPMLRVLLKKGAKVDFANRRGDTALHIVARTGTMPVLEILVKKGANVNAPNKGGQTPIFLAVQNNHTETVRFFAQNGGNLSYLDARTGMGFLHSAARNGNRELCEFLLSKNAPVNSKDKSGRTPLYYAAKYGFRDLFEILKAKGAAAKDMVKNFGPSPFLTKPLENGKAVIWYLGHAGWAVKTKSRLLVFDYWKSGTAPHQASLANGHIAPGEIKDLDVYVFVSHGHHDHFDKEIFEWRKQVKKVTYIFGMPVEKEKDIVLFSTPREVKNINGMDVYTINHNFDGIPESAFVVSVDGLTLYHSGDHGNGPDKIDPKFKDNIDYLSKKLKAFDVVLMPAFGGPGFPGEKYALEKLSPRVLFPMHNGGTEYKGYEFKKAVEKLFPKIKIVCPDHSGDRFLFPLNGKK